MTFPKVLRGKAWKFGVKKRRGVRPPLRRPPQPAELLWLRTSRAVARRSRATRSAHKCALFGPSSLFLRTKAGLVP